MWIPSKCVVNVLNRDWFGMRLHSFRTRLIDSIVLIVFFCSFSNFITLEILCSQYVQCSFKQDNRHIQFNRDGRELFSNLKYFWKYFVGKRIYFGKIWNKFEEMVQKHMSQVWPIKEMIFFHLKSNKLLLKNFQFKTRLRNIRNNSEEQNECKESVKTI